MVMLLRLSQSLNAKSPTLITLSGIVMLKRLSQPPNARQPIEITLSGMVIPIRLLQYLNALSPILLTGFSLYVAGITISESVALPIPVTE